MLALMSREVDEVTGLRDASERSLGGALDRRDERDHRPVVRCIGRHVEQVNRLDGGDRIANGLDDLGPAAFGEIRNALDELHRELGIGNRESGAVIATAACATTTRA